jgi:alpha/beta hydrolase family protein
VLLRNRPVLRETAPAAWGRPKTKADRMAMGNPRLSLEERYHDHAGCVRAVTDAANHAVDIGFLLPADRDALIAQARASTVLNPRDDEPWWGRVLFPRTRPSPRVTPPTSYDLSFLLQGGTTPFDRA